VVAEHDRKQDWRYCCACALKKSPKHSENVFRQKSYSPVAGNRGRRSEWRGQIFDRKLVNGRFCACAVKNRPKTRLLCCQIAKILAPLWAIAVVEHDGIQTRIRMAVFPSLKSINFPMIDRGRAPSLPPPSPRLGVGVGVRVWVGLRLVYLVLEHEVF